MSLGMTYEQYWDGDADLVIYFRKAHEMTIERQNRMLYLAGAYLYDTLLRVANVFNPFNKVPPQPYRDGVIPLTDGEKEERFKADEKKKLDSSTAAMMQMMHSVNKGRQKNGKRSD